MDWKRETEETLRTYAPRKASLQRSAELIRVLEEQLVSIRSATADGSPVQGGGSRREDAILDNIAQREELARARRTTARWLAVVDSALAELSPEEQLILDRFYIHRQRGAAERLQEELHLEKSQVYDRKNRTLRRLTLALYGIIET